MCGGRKSEKPRVEISFSLTHVSTFFKTKCWFSFVIFTISRQVWLLIYNSWVWKEITHTAESVITRKLPWTYEWELVGFEGLRPGPVHQRHCTDSTLHCLHWQPHTQPLPLPPHTTTHTNAQTQTLNETLLQAASYQDSLHGHLFKKRKKTQKTAYMNVLPWIKKIHNSNNSSIIKRGMK